MWPYRGKLHARIGNHAPDRLRAISRKGCSNRKISSDGNSIVGGTTSWTYHPCCGLSSGPYLAAWGTALNTVPGSDAERAGSTVSSQAAPITMGDVIQGAKNVKDAIELFQFFSALLQ